MECYKEDFSTNCGNSDARCFRAAYIKDTPFPLSGESRKAVKKDPSLCDYCPYNKKYDGMTYNEFKAVEREEKLMKILK